jgi:hypothetical protein
MPARQVIEGGGRGRIEGAKHEDAANGVLVVQVRCFRAIPGEISELAARETTLMVSIQVGSAPLCFRRARSRNPLRSRYRVAHLLLQARDFSVCPTSFLK